MTESRGSIAYVLKSFPRLSETFIASEIYRLERLDMPLRLFVIKRSDEPFVHPVAGAVRSPRVHLPDTHPISSSALAAWLRRHARRFAAPLGRQMVRQPFRTLRAASTAFMHAVRARKGSWMSLRTSTLKEFLQAAALADAIATAGDVRHIHAHFCHSATTVAWLAAIMTGIPLSFTAHAKDVYCEELNPAGLLVRKLAAARFVVTCTDANRTYLQQLTATPVHCLYHGLDVEFARLCGATVRPRQFDRRIRALAVGRLVAKKGLDVFIEACAVLRDRGIGLEAVVVGESGDQEGALHALVAARGLHEVVRFTGPLTQAELFEQYGRATVFCMLSRVLENGDRDGIPNVLAEAMACGVPVVATAVSGIPELLDHDINGLLVAPDNAGEAADAMESLHRDTGRAERLSRNGRTIICHRFNGDASAQTLSRLLTTGAA